MGLNTIIKLIHRWAFSVFSVFCFFNSGFQFFFWFSVFFLIKKAFTTNWTSMILFSLMHSLKITFVATYNGEVCSYLPIFDHTEFIFKTFRHLQNVVNQNLGSGGSKMVAKIGKITKLLISSKLSEIQS
jgi:hypothetical protein